MTIKDLLRFVPLYMIDECPVPQPHKEMRRK